MTDDEMSLEDGSYQQHVLSELMRAKADGAGRRFGDEQVNLGFSLSHGCITISSQMCASFSPAMVIGECCDDPVELDVMLQLEVDRFAYGLRTAVEQFKTHLLEDRKSENE